MHYKKLLLAGASLLAMTPHASADPIFTPLTFFLFSAAPAWIAPGVIYAGLQIATVAGLAVAQVLGRQSRQQVDPQEVKNTSQGREGPGRYATGRMRLGARIAFGNTAGYDIYRVLLHCFGPIDAIEEYFYDGRSITVDPDGSVTSPPWATSDGSNMYVRSKMGTGDDTVWPQLKEDFPDLIDDDFRNRGIGQTLLQIVNPGTANERFQTLLQGGVKELEVQGRFGRFFDPRNGQTNWTLNGVLQCLHWFRLLPDMRDSLIDFTDIGMVATEGDQQVPTLEGTAPRCTISGGWERQLTTEIVEQMLESAGLEVRRTSGNLYTLHFIEDDPDSELTLYDHQIIDRDFSADAAAKRPNICRVSYLSPERQYELSELDLTVGAPWARVQEDIDKYGNKEEHVELPFCDNASQAQRIARRLFWMKRAQKGTIRTDFAGLRVWGRRTVTIEVPDVGEDGESAFVKCRISAPPRYQDSEGTVEIPVAVIPDQLKVPWDPDTDEVPPPPVLPNFEYESDLPKPAKPAQATVVQYADNTWETRVRFSGVDGGTTAEANYRYYVGGLPEPWTGMTEYQALGNYYAFVEQDTNGERTEFRVRFANSDGQLSYFSDVLDEDPLTVSNSQPNEPSLNVDSDAGETEITYTVRSTSSSMNVAKLTIFADGAERGSSHGRPGDELLVIFQRPVSSPVTSITAIAYTTNGTASPAATWP